MEISQVLNQLGLTDKEPDIYLALLRLPGGHPASTISTRVGLNRTTVYKTLMKLAKKGLVTKTQRHGITCFFAEDPENRLKTLVEKQQRRYADINDVILKALPGLTAPEDEKISSSMPRVRYYEGVEGIKQIYEAVLKEGKDYYRYGDITKIYGALGVYTDEYIKKRNKLGIKAHAIMPYYKKKDEKGLRKNAHELREVMYIPHELFPIEGEVRIFGDKVAIISLRKESLIGVIIESDTIARMFHSIFMLTWKDYAKKAVKKG